MSEHTADNDAARLALEALWGCGPGDMLTEAAPYPNDYGEPYEIAVGQVCKSSAHNYAYWDGRCQFATEAARVLPPAKGDAR